MSTEISRIVVEDEKDYKVCKLFVTRFCAADEDEKDRVRIQLFVERGEDYSWIVLDRNQWAQLVWDINRAFEEFPEDEC